MSGAILVLQLILVFVLHYSPAVNCLKFLFRGVIYQQLFGAAVGSPVSPLLASLFMDWLEKQAIATAPVECKPKCFGTDKEGSGEESYGPH